MEIVTACGTSVLSTIVEDLVKSTGRQVGYIFRFKSIIEDLNKEGESLRSAQVDMQSRVDIAIKNTEEIDKKVEEWLRDVTAVVADAEDLEKQTREKKTCLNGLCPNLIWRYQMARRAQKKIGIMSKLKDGGKFENIAHRTTLPGINVFTQKDFMPSESTTYAFNLIIEALRDDKTNVVGLYGMGGVGKTTLAKAVFSKAKEEEIFNEVVMVVVSNRDINKDEAKIRDIQGQLADFLNLELKEESIQGRAERLFMRLKNGKKILIILDDIWEKIELADIGIPVDKDCKIFLTTRQEKVCIYMGCQSQIPLDVLNEEEGLVLFKRHSGLNDDQSPTKIELAKEVVEECKGLPLAIVAIGSALKEQPIGEWKTATQKLKKSKLLDVDIVDEKLYACLKLSYDYLKNEKTKSCFLLCSLFPEDHEIDMEELVRYGPGLGLYQNTDSIEEARSELHVMVNCLKASSLLLDAKEGHVKMHDVVRDVALWITSKGEEVFMVKAGMGLTEWPEHEGLEQCTAISLLGNRIEVLPDGLVCPKLKILLLEGNDDVEVSDEFFEEMKTLKVASLIWIHLSLNSLQFLTNLVTLQLIDCKLRDISSLKKLAQLKILRLKGYGIVELPEELGEINKLRMLDIKNCSNLERIPANVILRLSQLEELYIGGNSFKAWVVEGTNAELSNASLSELYQLKHLTILSLNINVQPYLSKDFVLPTKLLRYDIRVNDYMEASYPKSRLLKIRGIEGTSLVAFKALYENVEYLELGDIKGCCQNMVPSIDETGLNELKRLSLTHFDELECIIDTTQQQDVAFSNLESPEGLENFINFYSENSSLNLWTAKEQLRGLNLWRHGLQNLKELKIRRCRWAQVLFQLEGVEQELSLPSLKVLELSGLEELECLCMGPTHLLSLPNLKKLEVYGCKKLRHMFSPSLARNLLQLEELSITGCGELEYIVSIKAEENVGGGGGNDVMLPKLRILELYGVENFINFFDSENLSLNMQTTKKQLLGLRHGLPNLEKLYIKGYRVQVLFHLEGLEQELAFPSLKVLVLYNLEELECLCKGPTHLLSLPNLKKLEVYSCNRMRHMFSPSLARNLLQLEELIIWHCEKLEYIVSIKAEENVGGGGGNDVMLPKLRILRLSRVENFIDFCSENSSLNVQTTKKQLRGLRHGLQNLEELDISECRVQVLFHLEGLEQELAFSSLKVLKLYDLKELECLCKGPMHLLSLPKLKELSVYGCNRLRHMFSPSLARNFMQLEVLIIKDCGELEQIFIEDDAAEYHPTLLKDHLQWPLLFPNLSYITIKGCDKLKTLFPAVTTARSGLQKLKTLIVEKSSQLEELFGHKGEADMTSEDREMVLPQLKELTLQQLASLVNFCPVGYHFIFPSLSELVVTECPKLTIIFSVDQNRSVHAEAEAPQIGKEDVDTEQSPLETTKEIECLDFDDLQSQLPTYIGK